MFIVDKQNKKLSVQLCFCEYLWYPTTVSQDVGLDDEGAPGEAGGTQRAARWDIGRSKRVLKFIVFISAEQKRKEAIESANELTQALVDHLNVG